MNLRKYIYICGLEEHAYYCETRKPNLTLRPLQITIQTMQTIKAKPFIKWVEGKSQLIDKIEANLPARFMQFDTYVEPFVGGGTVLFYVLQNYKNINHVIINLEFNL